MDAHANFAYSIVQAPAPGIAGTSLVVAAGQGALFPAVPFNCTVWPSGVQPLASNAEIVRVTAIVGDTLTITRAQEGTTNKNIEAGYQIANTASNLVFTDIENTMLRFVAVNGNSLTAPGVEFQNGNGVTFGTAPGNLITASINPAGGGIAASAGAESISNGTLVFANSNGITFGLNNSTLTASHNGLTSQSNQAASASNGSFTFQTLNFSNSNGITFGTAPGGIIFASHNGITQQSTQPVAASASNGSFLFSTLSFTNANNVTFGTSAGGIIFASVAPPSAASINFSAGTTSNNLTAVTFANSNGVTFGLNNGTITASVDTAGGAAGDNATIYAWETPPLPAGADVNGFTHHLGQIDPLFVPNNLRFSNFKQHGSFQMSLNSSNASSSVSAGATRFYAVFSRSQTNSTAADFTNSSVWLQRLTCSVWTTAIYSVSSQSYSFQVGWMTDSTGGASTFSSTTTGNSVNVTRFSGYQFLNCPYSDMLTRGEYIMFNMTRTTGTGGHQSSLLRMSFVAATIFGSLSMAPAFGVGSAQSVLPMHYRGVQATSTIPTTLNLSDFDRSPSANNYIFEG